MGGKPSLLLPGTAGTKSALWQGGKQPLGDAEGGFFDEWRIGAAVSLGVACVDADGDGLIAEDGHGEVRIASSRET